MIDDLARVFFSGIFSLGAIANTMIIIYVTHYVVISFNNSNTCKSPSLSNTMKSAKQAISQNLQYLASHGWLRISCAFALLFI